MSKLAILLMIPLFGAGILMYTTHQTGAFDPDYSLPKKGDESSGEVKGFKQTALDEGCVQSLFPKVKEDNSTTSIGDEDIKTLAEDASGCLVVNWDRGQGTTKSQWKGNFRFLWAMKSGDNGFIVFASGDTSSDNSSHKINFEAIASAVEKGDDGNGIIKKKTEAAGSNKSVDKDNFLKLGETLKRMDKKRTYWGFAYDDEEGSTLETLDEGKRKEEVGSYARKYWTGKKSDKSSAKTPDSGTSNWDKGCKAMFDSSEPKIKEAVKNIQGMWHYRSFVPRPN